MAKLPAENRRQIPGELPIDLLTKLRGQSPEVYQAVQAISNRLRDLSHITAAAAGLKGTVEIALQTTKDAQGNLNPGLDLQMNRIASVAPPVNGSDAATQDWVLSLFSCPRIRKIIQQCLGTTVTPPVAQAGASIIHDFWFPTFEPPMNTVSDDPGILESGQGSYLVITLPATTIFDKVAFCLNGKAGLAPPPGPASVAIYPVDASSSSYPLLAFAQIAVDYHNPNIYTADFGSTLTLPPGAYAIGWFSFCILFEVANMSLNVGAIANRGFFNMPGPPPQSTFMNPPVPHSGVVTLDGVGIASQWPQALTPLNTFPSDQVTLFPVQPVLYFYDSAVYGG